MLHYRKTIAFFLIFIEFNACARMVGYHSDYGFLDKDELIRTYTNNTEIYKTDNYEQQANGNYRVSGEEKQYIYYGKNKKYFALVADKNGKNIRYRYDKGKWYLQRVKDLPKADTHAWYQLCLASDYNNDTLRRDCTLIIRNGGKLNLGTINTPLMIDKGQNSIKKVLLNSENLDAQAFDDYSEIFGKDPDVFAKKEKEAARLLSRAKKEAEKESFDIAEKLLQKARKFKMYHQKIKSVADFIEQKKRERDIRLARERKERKRLAKIRAKEQNSHRQTYDYATSAISVCYPAIPQPIEYSECSGARTASGKYATVQLKRGGTSLTGGANCFDLTVYANGNIGNGSTCGGANGNWSVIANRQSSYANGLGNAIAWLLQRM